jgi:hypothetical protein
MQPAHNLYLVICTTIDICKMLKFDSWCKICFGNVYLLQKLFLKINGILIIGFWRRILEDKWLKNGSSQKDLTHRFKFSWIHPEGHKPDRASIVRNDTP